MNIIKIAKDKIDNIKKEKINYQETIKKTLNIENMLRLNITNKDENIGQIDELITMCPNLNSEEATFIYNTIPLWETIIYIGIIKHITTKDKYYLISTNRWIWILNENAYKIINYNEIYIMEIIKKSILTQTININQIILTIDDYIPNVNKLINIIKNESYRKEQIEEKNKYLCGTIPKYQTLNKIKSGITIDKDNNIVFHDRKKNNILCKYEEIQNYEILEDQTAVIKKKQDNQQNSIPFAKEKCMRISLRITFNDNRLFMISILEPSNMNKEYSHNDTIYKTNMEFAKKIINILESYNIKK